MASMYAARKQCRLSRRAVLDDKDALQHVTATASVLLSDLNCLFNAAWITFVHTTAASISPVNYKELNLLFLTFCRT